MMLIVQMWTAVAGNSIIVSIQPRAVSPQEAAEKYKYQPVNLFN